ncbi:MULTISPECIES: tetratricopeptide repeat protein [unclassified Kitasatospora]|uniref:tetratricopeptide repeat protein n=1 Tax=unclassified Kitasatospora TaxID=2633591 RepID=UPI0033F03DE6
MLDHLITHDDNLRMVPTDRNELTTAVSRLREELRALPEESDPARTRVLTRWIGIGQMCLGRHAEARAFLRQSLDLAAAIGNTQALVATGLNLGDAHRYAGDLQKADALYRSALNTARSRHPELVDFALQHTGKHLMERGDLAGAQAHLQEAMRLRIAKGNTELVESTQAALDRVELMLGDVAGSVADIAAPSRWSGQWTSWLQSRTTAKTPVRWAEDFPALRDAVRGLTAHQRVPPHHLRDQSFPAELIAAMAEEAEKAVAAGGYLHNGKWNAPVGDAANRFAEQVDLAAVVGRSTGLDVEQPHTGVYIGYEEGQFLDFHVDESGFGEANLILCLKHARLAGAPRASTTVFINANGYLECDLAAGDCVVFDGALTPHGRTPLSAGESVTLISIGFRARDRALRTLTNLPPVPR